MSRLRDLEAQLAMADKLWARVSADLNKTLDVERAESLEQLLAALGDRRRRILDVMHAEMHAEMQRLLTLFWDGRFIKRPGYIPELEVGAVEMEGGVYDFDLRNQRVIYLGPAGERIPEILWP